jgi:hypothetical protein
VQEKKSIGCLFFPAIIPAVFAFSAGCGVRDGGVDASLDGSFDGAQDGALAQDGSFDDAQDGSEDASADAGFDGSGVDAGEDSGPGDGGYDGGGQVCGKYFCPPDQFCVERIHDQDAGPREPTWQCMLFREDCPARDCACALISFISASCVSPRCTSTSPVMVQCDDLN